MGLIEGFILREDGAIVGYAAHPPMELQPDGTAIAAAGWTRRTIADAADLESFLNPPLVTPPDWNGFFERFESSDIAMRIMSSRSPVLVWLIVEFGKRSTGSIEVPRLVNYWNQTILGLPTRLSAEQIDRMNEWAIAFHLPVRVAENSNLTMP